MRWHRPQLGEVRTRILFAFLPTPCDREWVWLERVKTTEVYSEVASDDPFAEADAVVHQWVGVSRVPDRIA